MSTEMPSAQAPETPRKLTAGYLLRCLTLAIILFAASLVLLVGMNLPIAGALDDLSRGTGDALTGSVANRLLGNELLAGALAVAALACLALVIRGMVGDRPRRVVWAIMLVLCLWAAVNAATAAFFGPKVRALLFELDALRSVTTRQPLPPLP